MTNFQDHLSHIKNDNSLSQEDMESAMRIIMSGEVEEEPLTEFLTILADRGETVDEITGAARVMREMATSIQAPPRTLDCCGTGGDGMETYNISTAVALVCAACDIPVAKHGNRAASSKCGAADVLEELGVKLEAPLETLERSLDTLGFCFLMAPQHHQAMKHVAPVRKKLNFRTIFNLLGPLANPAGAEYQLIGVYDTQWILPMAQVLKNLGTKSAWIVNGNDGLDEITTTTNSKIAMLHEDGSIEERMVCPEEDFGLSFSDPNDLKGGSVQENADALFAVLNGEKNAYRDIVVANAAAVLMLYGHVNSLEAGARMAEQTIDFKKALGTLTSYIELTRNA